MVKTSAALSTENRCDELVKVYQSLIKFYRFKKNWKKFSCPACQNYSRKIKLCIRNTRETLPLFACDCGTLFYPNATAPNYEIVENEESFYMRIDQAEGIDSALKPLFSSPDLSDYDVIDIGCGVGFTSDFVRFQGRFCLAFDPSSAANMSREKLGIQINIDLATEMNTKVNGKKLIFCSEVIEHVEKPATFVQQLFNIAGENGFLIATTPNANFVNHKNPISTIYSMLAPSQHLFLLSPGALQNLALQAGFKWAYSWTQNERLFLIAGPRSINISNCFHQEDYINYLVTQLKNDGIEKIIRYRAFGYRLFKELVHTGHYSESSVLWEEIALHYAQLNIDINDPLTVVDVYKRAAIDNKLPNPKLYPYNVPVLLFLKGTLLIAYDHDKQKAELYYRAAIELSDLYSVVSTQEVFQVYDLEIQNVKDWSLKAIKDHGILST